MIMKETLKRCVELLRGIVNYYPISPGRGCEWTPQPPVQWVQGDISLGAWYLVALS